MVTRPDNCSEAFALSDSNVTFPPASATSSCSSSPCSSSPAAECTAPLSTDRFIGDRAKSPLRRSGCDSTSFTCTTRATGAHECEESEEQSPLLTLRERRLDAVDDDDDVQKNDTLCDGKSQRNTEKCNHVNGSECTSLLQHRYQVHSDCESSEQLHHLPTSFSSTLESSTQGIACSSHAASSSPSHNRTDNDGANAHSSSSSSTLRVNSTHVCNKNTNHVQSVVSHSSSSSSSSTCTTISTSSQLVSQTNLWRTFVYIFWYDLLSSSCPLAFSIHTVSPSLSLSLSLCLPDEHCYYRLFRSFTALLLPPPPPPALPPPPSTRCVPFSSLPFSLSIATRSLRNTLITPLAAFAFACNNCT